MGRIPVFQPRTIRLWELAGSWRGRLAGFHRLRAIDSPDPFPPGSHMHAVPHLVICLAGAARLRYQRSRILDLAPGEAAFLAPGTWHHHEPLRAGAVTLVQGLLPAASDVILWDGPRQISTLVPREPSAGLLHRLLEAADSEAALGLCEEILAQFLTEDAKEWEILDGPLGAMTFFLWHRLHQPITAADIIAASGLGGSQANRLFRAYHGTSPKQALLEARLAVAHQLLSEGMPAGAVPARCGFANGNSLARACRRRYGQPPRAVRRAGAAGRR